MKKRIIILAVLPALFPLLLLGYTGEVVKSFKTPGSYTTGLTYDGKNIWLADRKTDLIYCIDPSDGKVVRSIKAPAYWPTGLAWDGECLWNADIRGGIPLAENNAGRIYRIDPKDGTIVRAFAAPSVSPVGLAWDGKYLWCADEKTDEIIQFSAEDGTTIRSLKSPAGDPNGLAYDGKYLWVSDRIKDEIYMIDPVSGCVIIITQAPGPYTNSLCFDGTSLWAGDYQNDMIYRLKIRDGEQFKTDNENRSRVTYTYTVDNYGPGTVKEMDIYLAIPTDRVNQTIDGKISYSPEYTNIVTDQWGQQSARYHLRNLKPGESQEIQMVSTITTRAVRYYIYPEKVGPLSAIPEDISSKYLADNEKFQYTDPVITGALKEAVGDEKNPYWITRRIFNYIIDHMYYEMIGGWNTAPTVLARGNGSCSEYSFVFISMCRASGIPARYVGSVVVRGDAASMDNVFHRWVEVYLPGYGWIPVDPSGGDKAAPRDQADRFGALSNRFCITTQSGGGSTTLGWTYNSNETWTADPLTNVVYEYFADWEPID
jgi:transglutaminase-like putative cysteine protease